MSTNSHEASVSEHWRRFGVLARLMRDSVRCFAQKPRRTLRLGSAVPMAFRGMQFAEQWTGGPPPAVEATPPNPLRAFVDGRTEGRGVWKWLHYFDTYHRHFAPFVGRPVHVLEIGIYSGGSLDLWAHYFGPASRVTGVDIVAACKVYESERVRIFIGDQADRAFWAEVKAAVPVLDVVIDDGGHQPEQQIVSLEELLPHLRPGGVYLCEDIHGADNEFTDYLHGLAKSLHAFGEPTGPDHVLSRSAFQQAVGSIHIYPFVAVVERLQTRAETFSAPKRGTEWRPRYG